MAFIFIGQVNVLAPIVTINFMLTYSIIDYSYFSVAMSYNLQVKERRPLIENPCPRKPLVTANHPCYGSNGALSKHSNGTLLEFTKDMDQIFTLPSADSTEEEKASNHVAKVWGRKAKVPAKETLSNSFGLDFNSNTPLEKEKDEKALEQNNGPDDETSSQTGLFESEPGGKRKLSLPTQSPTELDQIPGEASDTNGEWWCFVHESTHNVYIVAKHYIYQSIFLYRRKTKAGGFRYPTNPKFMLCQVLQSLGFLNWCKYKCAKVIGKINFFNNYNYVI